MFGLLPSSSPNKIAFAILFSLCALQSRVSGFSNPGNVRPSSLTVLTARPRAGQRYFVEETPLPPDGAAEVKDDVIEEVVEAIEDVVEEIEEVLEDLEDVVDEVVEELVEAMVEEEVIVEEAVDEVVEEVAEETVEEVRAEVEEVPKPAPPKSRPNGNEQLLLEVEKAERRMEEFEADIHTMRDEVYLKEDELVGERNVFRVEKTKLMELIEDLTQNLAKRYEDLEANENQIADFEARESELQSQINALADQMADTTKAFDAKKAAGEKAFAEKRLAEQKSSKAKTVVTEQKKPEEVKMIASNKPEDVKIVVHKKPEESRGVRLASLKKNRKLVEVPDAHYQTIPVTLSSVIKLQAEIGLHCCSRGVNSLRNFEKR
jgi:chromosome segregation ATPase